MDTTVLIIGGGLSGITVAHQLTRRGVDCLLLEARDIPGGRILSPQTGIQSASRIAPAVDLGPSWFWPDQRAIAALVKDAGLTEAVFEQASQGKSVIEYANGSLTRSHGGASMAGSLRINGGMVHLVNRLAETLAQESILCNTTVQQIALSDQGVVTTAITGEQALEFNSRHVVLALPPRVVADSIDMQPVISPDYRDRLRSVSTWMAGEAKLVATYTTPFWQEQGLSGDGMSQVGPMAEIHDASPHNGRPYALFGFVGVPSSQRENRQAEIRQTAVEQITRMFGAAGADPIEVYFKDWAFDSLTATGVDRNSHRAHPDSSALNRTEWDQKLIWAGSEMAGPGYACSGYLEGAVEAANLAIELLTDCDG